MIPRPRYLDQLIAFKDKDLIKVVTGVRRCGKSTLLDLMREHLASEGVPDSRLMTFRMESMEFDEVRSYKDLYGIVSGRIEGIEHPYLFFDELQEVENWERCINALRVDHDCDIYITGSNAYLLSSELSTMLSGRYVEIEVLPLVFSEYLLFREAEVTEKAIGFDSFVLDKSGKPVSIRSMFEDFALYGGMPFLALSEPNQEEHAIYMRSLYQTIIVRDILERDKRKGRRNLRNAELLERLCSFLADNIGNENSINSIAKCLKGETSTLASDTVDAYLSALIDAYLFYTARRYDIKGKQLLKTFSKQYIVDVGMRSYLDSYRRTDHGRVLENIVYLQLRFLGYEIWIGKLRDVEVDFVATRGSERLYIQVTESMASEQTQMRELLPLRKVKDAYPKIIIVQDGPYPIDIDGIRIVNLYDFLINGL